MKYVPVRGQWQESEPSGQITYDRGTARQRANLGPTAEGPADGDQRIHQLHR